MWATLIALWAAESRAASPYSLSYGGRLADASGAPVTGPVELKLKFFDAATGGSQLGPDVDLPSVALASGVFQAPVALDGATFQQIFGAGNQVYIEVTDVTHGQIYPRQSFSAVPYALRVPVDQTTITYDSSGNLTLTNPNALPVSNGAFTTPVGLDVLASDPTSLTAADAGKIWYNGGIKYWNGSSVQLLGVSGGGIQSLNGLTDNTQTLAVGIGGTSPSWVDAGSTHTLDLPLASGAGVTAGLISSADWAAFNSKGAGQWTTSGTTVFYNGGNVGIGTTSPSANLQVANSTTDPNPPVGGLGCTYDGFSCVCNHGYNFIDGNGNGKIDANECYLPSLTTGVGFVGIGTTSPTAPLEVGRVGLFSGATMVVNGGINQNSTSLDPSAEVYGGAFAANVTTVSGDNSNKIVGVAAQAFGGGFNNLTGSIIGVDADAVGSTAGIASSASNVYGVHSVAASNGLSGNSVTNGSALYAQVQSSSLALMANGYGLYVDSPTGGNFTSVYGLYLANQTGGTAANYSIYSAGGTNYFAGNVGIGTTNPTSTLQTSGAIATAIAVYSGSTTLGAGDSVVLANASTGPITMTLPAASSCPGRQYTIKKWDNGGNAITVAHSGSDQIEGAASYSLGAWLKYVTLVSDGNSSWYVIANN